MLEKQLGVIIPVYNVEPYLDKCIESIVNQTYHDLEIVLVDDGSSDSSYEICQKWAQEDSRIKCYHFEESGGAVRARQKGMELTTTDYVTYVDSDDWMELDAFEKMMKAILESNAELVISTGRIHELKNKQVMTKDNIEAGVYAGKAVDIIREKMIRVEVWPCLWNHVYKKESHMQYQMKTDKRIRINNDIVCMMMNIMHIEKVVVIDENLYHYRQNDKSITTTYKTSYLLSNCLLYQLVKEEILNTKRENFLQEWKVHFLEKLFMNIRIECSMENKISTSEKMQHLRELYAEKIFDDFLKDDNRFDFKGRDAMIWRLVQKKRTWTLFFYLKANALKCRLLEIKTRA